MPLLIGQCRSRVRARCFLVPGPMTAIAPKKIFFLEASRFLNVNLGKFATQRHRSAVRSFRRTSYLAIPVEAALGNVH